MRTMSARSRSCTFTALRKSASRKPSCMNMRITANATPAIATASRTFCRRSWSHARRAAEIMATSVGRDRDFDLEIRERGAARAVVEDDLDRDDARVGARRGIRVEHVEPPDLHADALDAAGERTVERRARHRRALPDLHAPDVGLVDLGDRVH